MQCHCPAQRKMPVDEARNPLPALRAVASHSGGHCATATIGRDRENLEDGLRLEATEPNQPSMDAIRLALPPAAVVSMQVTRSVAKRAT